MWEQLSALNASQVVGLLQDPQTTQFNFKLTAIIHPDLTTAITHLQTNQ